MDVDKSFIFLLFIHYVMYIWYFSTQSNGNKFSAKQNKYYRLNIF